MPKGRLFTLAAAALSLAGATTVTAAPAVAQENTRVVVVDEQRVARESKAGQDMQAKLSSIEQQMNTELQPKMSELQGMEQEIGPKIQGKSLEELRADETLTEDAQAYREAAASLKGESDKRKAEMQLTMRQASAEFNKVLQPVLQEVMAESGADVMLSRGDVLLAKQGVDVTDTVIQKLDEASPTLNVQRQRLPEQASNQQIQRLQQQ